MSDNADNSAIKQQNRVVGKPFPKGVSGNPAGRPKGSFSMTTKITKILEENPDQLGEIIKSIFEKHPDLVWKMIDGQPKGDATLNVENLENLTIVLDRED